MKISIFGGTKKNTFRGKRSAERLHRPNIHKFKAAGIQIDPENGITRKEIFDLMLIIDDKEYEIISFDADNAICYFIFSFKYFEDSIDGKLLEFKDMFISIANDMRLENLDHIYYFENEQVYFGY